MHVSRIVDSAGSASFLLSIFLFRSSSDSNRDAGWPRGQGKRCFRVFEKRSCGAPDLEFPKKAADEQLPTDGALHGLHSAPVLFSEPRPPAFLLRAGVSPVGTPPSLGTNSFPVKSQVFNHVRLLVSRIRQGISGRDVFKLETRCFQVMNSCQSATMISE